MSLILTHIDHHGIVHAADSNLTSVSGRAAGTGTKIFNLPTLRAGLSLAGSYSVNDVAMDKWMPRVIADYELTASPNLAGFAESLRSRLEIEMTSYEKKGGCLVHAAGFVKDSAGQHPELYFIRNISGIDPTSGAYLSMGPSFEVTEDFWARDVSTPSTRTALASGSGRMLYINGFPSGRIAYLGLSSHLQTFLEAVWNNADWSFRPPKTLDDVAVMLKMHLSVIGAMFEISDYSAPFIGGEAQTLLIRP